MVLEPQTVEHAAEMFDLLSDSTLYELEGSPPESEAWLAERFARLESRASPDGREQWLNWVIRMPSGALAGYVQATIDRDRVAHIAYVLGSRFWGRGIATVAVSRMLDELETVHGVRELAATLKAQNLRSLALLRRLGFEHEGCDESGEIVMRKSISVEATRGARE